MVVREWLEYVISARIGHGELDGEGGGVGGGGESGGGMGLRGGAAPGLGTAPVLGMKENASEGRSGG